MAAYFSFEVSSTSRQADGIFLSSLNYKRVSPHLLRQQLIASGVEVTPSLMETDSANNRTNQVQPQGTDHFLYLAENYTC